jgi:hypothetical protein
MNKLQQTSAMLFIHALKVDVQLRDNWRIFLDKIKKINNNRKHSKELLQQEVDQASNFLSDNGFDCDVKDVLMMLKSDFFLEYQKIQKPNIDSTRFVKDVLSNKNLYNKWLKVVSKSKNNIDAVNDFLKESGYDCLAIQVVASFRKLRNHASVYWAGAYVTTLKDEKGNKQKGPILIVSDRGHLSIDKDKPDKRLNKLAFSNGKFTWKADDLRIKYSAEIQFREQPVAKKGDNYTGNVVFGKITFPKESFNSKYSGQYSIYGINEEIDADAYFDQVPANISLPKMNSVVKCIGYFVAGLFVINMIYSIGTKLKGSVAGFVEKFKSSSAVESFDSSVNSLEEGLSSSNSTSLLEGKLNDSDIIQDIQERIDFSDSSAEKNALEDELSESMSSEADFENGIEDFASGEGSSFIEDISKAIL